jgi:hypothetical protein
VKLSFVRPKVNQSRRGLVIRAAVLCAALALNGALVARSRHMAPATVAEDAAVVSARRAGSLPSLSGSSDPSVVVAPVAPAPVAPAPRESIAERVPQSMTAWREAIIHKNAETVEALDRAFAEYPRAFIPALMESAKSDPEERVRSFSTRVLGKLRSSECLALMRQLLDDQSAYVRFNAAWALGELEDKDATYGCANSSVGIRRRSSDNQRPPRGARSREADPR